MHATACFLGSAAGRVLLAPLMPLRPAGQPAPAIPEGTANIDFNGTRAQFQTFDLLGVAAKDADSYRSTIAAADCYFFFFETDSLESYLHVNAWRDHINYVRCKLLYPAPMVPVALVTYGPRAVSREAVDNSRAFTVACLEVRLDMGPQVLSAAFQQAVRAVWHARNDIPSRGKPVTNYRVCGGLRKKGGTFGWKSRYFVLRDNILYCYKSEKKFSTGAEQPKSTIVDFGPQAVSQVTVKGKYTTFAVSTPIGLLWLKADNEVDYLMWQRAFLAGPPTVLFDPITPAPGSVSFGAGYTFSHSLPPASPPPPHAHTLVDTRGPGSPRFVVGASAPAGLVVGPSPYRQAPPRPMASSVTSYPVVEHADGARELRHDEADPEELFHIAGHETYPVRYAPPPPPGSALPARPGPGPQRAFPEPHTSTGLPPPAQNPLLGSAVPVAGPAGVPGDARRASPMGVPGRPGVRQQDSFLDDDPSFDSALLIEQRRLEQEIADESDRANRLEREREQVLRRRDEATQRLREEEQRRAAAARELDRRRDTTPPRVGTLTRERGATAPVATPEDGRSSSPQRGLVAVGIAYARLKRAADTLGLVVQPPEPGAEFEWRAGRHTRELAKTAREMSREAEGMAERSNELNKIGPYVNALVRLCERLSDLCEQLEAETPLRKNDFTGLQDFRAACDGLGAALKPLVTLLGASGGTTQSVAFAHARHTSVLSFRLVALASAIAGLQVVDVEARENGVADADPGSRVPRAGSVASARGSDRYGTARRAAASRDDDDRDYRDRDRDARGATPSERRGGDARSYDRGDSFRRAPSESRFSREDDRDGGARASAGRTASGRRPLAGDREWDEGTPRRAGSVRPPSSARSRSPGADRTDSPRRGAREDDAPRTLRDRRAPDDTSQIDDSDYVQAGRGAGARAGSTNPSPQRARPAPDRASSTGPRDAPSFLPSSAARAVNSRKGDSPAGGRTSEAVVRSPYDDGRRGNASPARTLPASRTDNLNAPAPASPRSKAGASVQQTQPASTAAATNGTQAEKVSLRNPMEEFAVAMLATMAGATANGKRADTGAGVGSGSDTSPIVPSEDLSASDKEDKEKARVRVIKKESTTVPPVVDVPLSPRSPAGAGQSPAGAASRDRELSPTQRLLRKRPQVDDNYDDSPSTKSAATPSRAGAAPARQPASQAKPPLRGGGSSPRSGSDAADSRSARSQGGDSADGGPRYVTRTVGQPRRNAPSPLGPGRAR